MLNGMIGISWACGIHVLLAPVSLLLRIKRSDTPSSITFFHTIVYTCVTIKTRPQTRCP
jgi:hypothetical protein